MMLLPVVGPRKPRQAVIDPFTAYRRERVTRYPGLTGSRLFRELKDLGYGGGYYPKPNAKEPCGSRATYQGTQSRIAD